MTNVDQNFEKLVRSFQEFKMIADKVFDSLVQPEGLTSLQVIILFMIRDGEIQTIGDLSKTLCIDQGNASNICKRIEKAGVVCRQRDSEDERVVKVMITEKGKKVLNRIIEKVKENEYMVGIMAPERLERFIREIDEAKDILLKIGVESRVIKK